jgi:hypothetical protein
MAPPKPSRKPSRMNSSACWRLPLKACAMPPRHPDPPQLPEHLIDRAPDVQQHRQIGVAGDLQLLDEEMFLARNIGAGNEEIEADLADRHRP